MHSKYATEFLFGTAYMYMCDHQLQFGCAIAVIDCIRGVAITAEIPVATEFIYLQMGFQTLNMFSQS